MHEVLVGEKNFVFFLFNIIFNFVSIKFGYISEYSYNSSTK